MTAPTLQIYMMKGVTCYKDASEHDGYCNGNSGAHVQGGGQLDLTSR